jgi:hypothetical protein
MRSRAAREQDPPSLPVDEQDPPDLLPSLPVGKQGRWLPDQRRRCAIKGLARGSRGQRTRERRGKHVLEQSGGRRGQRVQEKSARQLFSFYAPARARTVFRGHWRRIFFPTCPECLKRPRAMLQWTKATPYSPAS